MKIFLIKEKEFVHILIVLLLLLIITTMYLSALYDCIMKHKGTKTFTFDFTTTTRGVVYNYNTTKIILKQVSLNKKKKLFIGVVVALLAIIMNFKENYKYEGNNNNKRDFYYLFYLNTFFFHFITHYIFT